MLSDYEKRENYSKLSDLYAEIHLLDAVTNMDEFRRLHDEIETLLDDLDIHHSELPLTVIECVDYFHSLAGVANG